MVAKGCQFTIPQGLIGTPLKVLVWVFPKMVVPHEWFIMENHIKMDDLGVPLFLETPVYFNLSSFKTSLP